MEVAHGLELLRDQQIGELNTRARLYRHVQTGAELLSLSNEDENKVFGIAFRTPPKDSTGVAHILEHAVLCGSRKYPVKEPFVELLKGSLKTFLNAFTYPDKTCYPVASQNVRDFYNLIDVYLDAVFYPRITPFIFQQEGWHLELENPADSLKYKGVVFNEMKGAYSSPESLLAEYSQQSLFPDNTYGLDSGGDPSRIPALTYEQFKAFHEEHYHPSNARIFFYGNDDPDERLRIVNEYLKDFSRKPIDSAVGLQPRFDRPLHIERSYAAGSEATEAQGAAPRGMLTINWLLEEIMDPELVLGLQMLEYILIGMPGSPLRKALIDSGLGEDLTGVGLENDLRQIYFSTGLKGIRTEDADRIEALVLQILTDLASKGIDPLTVEAALNTIEFRLRENNSGSFPRGLVLMLRSLTTWLHGEDPLALLAFESPLTALKKRISSVPAYFEHLIERFLLNNSHRTTLILKPDPELSAREQAAEAERLDAVKQHMTAAQQQEIIDNTHKLQQMQVTPDPPEALATIPSLKVSDLDRRNKTIPKTLLERENTRVLAHDLFTNGIAYLDLGFDLHTLPQGYLPFVPLFSRALLEMGTEREDYVALTQHISRKTGGIRPEFFASMMREDSKATAWLFLRSKGMIEQADDLFNILRDVLLTVRFDNQERFRQMALEEKAKQEQRLIPNGHQVINMRLRAQFDEADWAAEQMAGVSYLLFLRRLAQTIDEDWPSILNTLEAMRRLLVNRNAMVCNLTLDETHWPVFDRFLRDFLSSLPQAPVQAAEWLPERPSAFEALSIPSLVNYVGKGADLYRMGYRFHGSVLAVTGYLRNSWLWEQIRVKGGAYGASCLFDRHSGILTFVSYRDPNLLKTLEGYDRAAEFLRNTALSQDELTKAVIGTIGNIDTYLLPDAKGYASLMRHLTGETEAARQQMREEILGTSAEDFKAFADTLDQVRRNGIVKILGSQAALEDVSESHPEWLTPLKVL